MEALGTSFSASTTAGNGHEGLRRKAMEMEAVFLNTLVSEMFKGIRDSDGAFGGGFASDTWRSMQSEQFAATIARSGGVGLADGIMKSLIGAQEQASTQTSNTRTAKE